MASILKVDAITGQSDTTEINSPITLSGNTATFGDINMGTGKSIKKADGTALLTEAGALDNVVLGSSVTGGAGLDAKGWVFISKQDISGLTDKIEFLTGIDTTYDNYKFIMQNVLPESDDKTMIIYARSTDGASPPVHTWHTSSGNYKTVGGYSGSSGSNAHTSQWETTTQFCIFANGVGNNVADGGVNAELMLYKPATAGFPHFIGGTFAYMNYSDNAMSGHISGQLRITTNAISGIRFEMSSGRFVSGRISLYGITHA